MNKKVKIILLSLLGVSVVACIVLYAVFPTQFKTEISHIWDILNKPLPIIGVTTLAVLVFVWKLVITTNYGKAKLQEYERQYKEICEEHKEFVGQANAELSKCYAKIDDLRHKLANACNLSTNQKIKALGKGLEYGKEETDCDTKEE